MLMRVCVWCGSYEWGTSDDDNEDPGTRSMQIISPVLPKRCCVVPDANANGALVYIGKANNLNDRCGDYIAWKWPDKLYGGDHLASDFDDAIKNQLGIWSEYRVSAWSSR